MLLEVVAAAPDRVGRAESAYETEAALAADGVTLIAVPAELVDQVRDLVAQRRSA